MWLQTWFSMMGRQAVHSYDRWYSTICLSFTIFLGISPTLFFFTLLVSLFSFSLSSRHFPWVVFCISRPSFSVYLAHLRVFSYFLNMSAHSCIPALFHRCLLSLFSSDFHAVCTTVMSNAVSFTAFSTFSYSLAHDISTVSFFLVLYSQL